ncbi:hypothetical protein WJR50_07400 [Catalinimonas sp. 4WD22]|uniref:hypothetical protein n=1 Tax=Catalinimonas locisalis TaxID=3133978 RepID=UPI00310109EB
MDDKIRLELTDFNVLSTGADGGHYYVTSNIQYKNQSRKIVIFFASKSDEKRLNNLNKVKIEGTLVDEGVHNSLNLLESKLID